MARLFGAEFATALFEQKTGVWVGPIPSGYGMHLVRVEAMTPGGAAALGGRAAARRARVGQRQAQGAGRQPFYARLREKYKVTDQDAEAARPTRRASEKPK